MKKQAGFTLIELIMVIVILGILSAFALPRFADLSGNAEAASMEGARASIQSASAIAHAFSLANNGPASATFEGVAVTLINGYPSADDSEDDICGIAGVDADFTCTTTTARAAGTAAILTVSGAGSCVFTYTEALTATSAPSFSAVTGC